MLRCPAIGRRCAAAAALSGRSARPGSSLCRIPCRTFSKHKHVQHEPKPDPLYQGIRNFDPTFAKPEGDNEAIFWDNPQFPVSDEIVPVTVGSFRSLFLNRTSQLNALTLDMVRQITPRLKAWEGARLVHAIMLRGVGKHFCAGGDVVSLYNAVKNKGDTASFFREEYALNYLISTLQTSYVAVMHGVTMGGGLGLSVHGEYRVVTDSTVIAMPETAIGFFPDVGGSYFLPRLNGALGMYLGLTGARLKGADVVHAGIGTHFVADHALPDFQLRLSEVQGGRDGVARCVDNHDEIEAQPPFSMLEHLDAIDRCFSADSVEEIIERLHKEKGDWAKHTIKQLSHASPLSLKVTHRLLKEGNVLSLEECLRNEFRLTRRFMTAESDFQEGVRALLVDKDKKPIWKYQSLKEVQDATVAKFFEPISDELLLGSLTAETEAEQVYNTFDPHLAAKKFFEDPSPNPSFPLTYNQYRQRR